MANTINLVSKATSKSNWSLFAQLPLDVDTGTTAQDITYDIESDVFWITTTSALTEYKSDRANSKAVRLKSTDIFSGNAEKGCCYDPDTGTVWVQGIGRSGMSKASQIKAFHPKTGGVGDAITLNLSGFTQKNKAMEYYDGKLFEIEVETTIPNKEYLWIWDLPTLPGNYVSKTKMTPTSFMGIAKDIDSNSFWLATKTGALYRLDIKTLKYYSVVSLTLSGNCYGVADCGDYLAFICR